MSPYHNNVVEVEHPAADIPFSHHPNPPSARYVPRERLPIHSLRHKTQYSFPLLIPS